MMHLIESKFDDKVILQIFRLIQFLYVYEFKKNSVVKESGNNKHRDFIKTDLSSIIKTFKHFLWATYKKCKIKFVGVSKPART